MTIQSLDTQLLLLVNHGAENRFFDLLMPALSQRGYLLIIPFLLAMFLRGAKQQDERGKMRLAAAVWTFLIACIAVYLAEHAEEWMKDAVARVRPCRAIEGVRLIVACPQSYSMPSGHALSSFSFAAPLFYLTRRYIEMVWRLYPLALASFIAFSRIYLGVHYPTDVLAGAVLGAAIGLSLAVLYELIATEEFMKRKKI
ncbi:MAG TPA: phosphatase PAP2 family protein [Nitrospirota bacterium]